ncbi:MAG: hypothetical protein KGL75_06810 [Acidobacteriota bacterium]|nr:hypothetical protein [Acidobacteriota bacterium]
MPETMDLKTFVETTIVQIIAGVESAIADLSKANNNAKINPVVSHALHSPAKDVEFDVAVTVTDSKSGGGGAALRIVGVQIGGQGEAKLESQAISRIKFAVPISVPSTPTEQYRG